MTSRKKAKDREPTFVGRARRKQLINATIETAATKGFLNTTLAEIAQLADITPGVIPYYFGSKDELVEDSMTELLARSDSYVAERVERESSVWGRLRTYVEAWIEYATKNRNAVVAEWELLPTFNSPERKRHYNTETYVPARRRLEAIVEEGIRSGEFRDVPVEPMAALILGALDGVLLMWTWAEDAVNLGDFRDMMVDVLETYLCEGACGDGQSDRS